MKSWSGITKEKKHDGSTPPDVMLRVVRQVILNSKSIKSTTKDFNVNDCVLAHYCNVSTPGETESQATVPTPVFGYKAPQQLELQLEKCLTRSADIYFGGSPTEVRKLAFKFAVAQNLKSLQGWADKDKASSCWFTEL